MSDTADSNTSHPEADSWNCRSQFAFMQSTLDRQVLPDSAEGRALVARIDQLKDWRKTSLYRSDKDYIFPSIQKNGEQPLHPEMVLRRHLRSALERIGVRKRIGWHSFRHGFSNLLRESRVDVNVAQELLRHANSRITLDIYQRTVTDERRAAQELVFRNLVGWRGEETLKNLKPDKKKKSGF